MNTTKVLSGVAGLALAALLAGCSAAEAPAPTRTPGQSTTLGKVSTISQLVKAYTDAGGVCNWKQTDVVKGAVASGSCSSAAVLSIYTGATDRDKVVKNIHTLPIASTLLVGENWIINAADAPGMATKLGGTAITGMPTADSSAPETFCSVFRKGDAGYLDFISGIGANLDVSTFQSKIVPYAAKIKSLAPSEEAKDAADYASVADQISAALASGGGSLHLDTTAYKSGAFSILTYCTGKE
ncbi:MAG: hypothetical protein JST33_16035 [Actinobacteria bacterium]|nr:hypothetical protein [Actinomycetota bacterium]